VSEKEVGPLSETETPPSATPSRFVIFTTSVPAVLLNAPAAGVRRETSFTAADCAGERTVELIFR
jgi:hypothetical protein